MIKKDLFQYQSYKPYLKDLIRNSPKHGRGMRIKLAEAAACQTTYVSQVLNGSRDFNLDQAEGINLYLQHSEDEARFFNLLVLKERAVTPALRRRLEREVQAEIAKRLDLKTRLKTKDTLSPEHQATYYSSWHYAAIRVLVGIPGYDSREKIAEALGLPLFVVEQAVEFLMSAGIIEKSGGNYQRGTSTVFVGKGSPFLINHHVTWRRRAVQSIEQSRPVDTHYSSVVGVSKSDAEAIRLKIMDFIEEIRKVWVPSKEEELHSFCIDFFQVDRQKKNG